jgi:hypothetical protein
LILLTDKEVCLSFADDSYLPKGNKSLLHLIQDVEKSLEAMTKWLRASGLEAYCSPNTDHHLQTRIQAKQTLNVLGISFDAKMCWALQVSNALRKSKKALNAIKLTRKVFNVKELIQTITKEEDKELKIRPVT